MEENIKINNKDLIKFYVEIIALGTFLGLLFPAFFLWYNRKKIPIYDDLFVFPIVLIISTFLFYLILTGKIFPKIKKKFKLKTTRLILYLWGVLLLIFASIIIHFTGGIQASIFLWLFEYGLIVTILVRPVDEKSFLKHWRPVLITASIEVLFITILMTIGNYVSPMSSEIQRSMPIWGGASAVCSLIASFFLFYINMIRNKEERRRNV